VTDSKPPNNGDDTAKNSLGVGTTQDAKTEDATNGDATTGDAAPEEPTTSPAAEQTAKSAFEAAIEKKKAAGQARSAHLDGGAKVGGATASHKTSRTFRRKSG
jgi:hypothetical protein